MATQTALDAPITLTPPTPVAAIAPEQAAGLVPLDEGQKSKLEQRVDGFISELSRSIPIRRISARRSIRSPTWAGARSRTRPATRTASSIAR